MKVVAAALSVMVCSAMAQVHLLGKGVGNFGVGFNNGRIAGKGYGYNPYNSYGYRGYGNGKGIGNVGVVGAGYGYNPYNNNYGYNDYGYGKGFGNVGAGKGYGNDYNSYNYNNNGYGKGHGDGLVGHSPFIAGHGLYRHDGSFAGHGSAGVAGHSGPFSGSFVNKASPYYYH